MTVVLYVHILVAMFRYETAQYSQQVFQQLVTISTLTAD